MRWFDLLQKTIALLSRMYLVMVICLGSWAVLPILMGWTPTVVMSESMLPSVEIGDVVVAQNITVEQQEELIAPGLVLLYSDPSKPERLVTHRVVNVIPGQGYITKGDANSKADPTIIPAANVQGIERLRIPMIGIPIQYARAGDFLPMIVFTIVTILAQSILMHDKKINGPLSVSKVPETVAEPRHGKGRHRASTSSRDFARFSGVTLTAAGLIVLSMAVASSAAVFSDTTTSSGSTFTTIADFSTVE